MQTESLDFDPAAFFGDQTGGMFTKSADTVAEEGKAKKKATAKPTKVQELPKEGDKPKKKFSSFGASWKKKAPVEATKLTLKTTIEVIALWAHVLLLLNIFIRSLKRRKRKKPRSPPKKFPTS